MLIQKPCLDNKDLLNQYLRYNNYPGCELSAANNILWSDFYDTGFIIIEEQLVFCKLDKSGDIEKMSFPVGNGDKKKAFDAIVQYFKDCKRPFEMYLVQDKMFELIQEWYPDVYEIKYNRDEADYIYQWDTLAYLKGKKLHGKRNHINRFLENYPDYEYENIGDSNYKECLELAKAWWENNKSSEENNPYELKALEIALSNMHVLGLEGALIRVQGKVIAFTVGEPLTEDTYVVHFEKAYADIQGAYAMINREFVRRNLKKYSFINREEDLGIPGLRHAKTSYQPIKLLEKGTVTEKIKNDFTS